MSLITKPTIEVLLYYSAVEVVELLVEPLLGELRYPFPPVSPLNEEPLCRFRLLNHF